MAETLLPAGTATGNADAVRQAPIAQAFFLFADVLRGIDAQPRMEPGMTNSNGVLGPSQTFGADVGVANDGSIYIRGRSSWGQDSMATPAHDAESGTAAKPEFKLGPLGWIVLGVIAYAVLK
jgi:hypothetical protein